MNELRRCSPEIERELHDKEARIRELEGVLRIARHFVVEPKLTAFTALSERFSGNRFDCVKRIDRALSSRKIPSPPDSEPRGEVVVTANERGDAVTVTRQDEEGEILSVIWERDSEPAGFDGEEENMRAQRLSDADGGQRHE